MTIIKFRRISALATREYLFCYALYLERKPQEHVSKMSARKTFSVLFEFEESKKQISIPNCDTEEVPEDLATRYFRGPPEAH